MKHERRLLVLAIACAVGAAVLTFRAGAADDRSDAQLVKVVFTTTALVAGQALTEQDVAALAVRPVSKRATAPDVLNDPLDAIGARPRVDLPEGTPLALSQLVDSGENAIGFRLRRGERAVSVEVVVSPAGRQLASGDQVDLFASGVGGNQRTSPVVVGAEVLSSDGGDRANPRITLRLAAPQVTQVVRADVFARELRAVARPPA